uniref:Uncharacterized protein n=1 Tax=Strongyloides venezuelensis TaxID=75913 RepID=A0A0K0FXA1_STRVS
MYIILHLIILIFQNFYNIEGSCNYYLNYNLLGIVKNASIQAKNCINDYVTCTYVSLSIPGLVVGSFSGCPEETDLILQTIINQRLDVFSEFKAFVNNNTKIIDHDLLCQHSINGNQPFIINTMSGKGRFFVHCHKQNETYNEPEVKFNLPTTDATPVKCNNGQGQDVCTEGYCGMFEISSISSNGDSQLSQKYQNCPNNIFNQMYLLATNPGTTFNKALLNDKYNIGPICVDKSSLKTLSKSGLSSYFWYINCYVPDNNKSTEFPEIPDLMLYATTTATIITSTPITTTTKLATSSCGHGHLSIISDKFVSSTMNDDNKCDVLL